MHHKHRHIKYNGKSGLLVMFFLIFFSGFSLAQADRKFIRQGNRQYSKEKFPESEIFYRRALDKNKESGDAVFNAGDALYKQKKYEDAGKQFIRSLNINENNEKKSAGLYNLGNSLLMANKLQESIEAYKNSLRLRPENMEAKYNLAYAQDLLKKQQEEQQKQQDKNNQDQNKDQQKENKEDNKNQDQEKEGQQDQKNDQQQQQNAEQQQQSMSKEDAERLLNAIANDEKKVQEKVKLAKAAKARVKTLKNW